MRRMAIAAVLVALFPLPALAQNRSQGTPTPVRGVVDKLDGQTLTPIQHLVVIFQENVPGNGALRIRPVRAREN